MLCDRGVQYSVNAALYNFSFSVVFEGVHFAPNGKSGNGTPTCNKQLSHHYLLLPCKDHAHNAYSLSLYAVCWFCIGRSD